MHRLTLTIGKKLSLIGGVGIAAALVVGGTAVVAVSELNALAERVNTYNRAQVLVRELDTRASELKVDGFKALVREDPDEERAELADDTAKVTERIEALRTLDLEASDKAAVEELVATFDTFVAGIGAVVDASVADQATAQRAWEDIQTANDTTDEAVGAINEKFDVTSSSLSDDLAKTSKTVVILVLLTLLVGTALVTVVSVYFGRDIIRRLRSMVATLGLVALGDLRVRSDATGRDEVGEMAAAVNEALGNLSTAFGSIGTTGTDLGAASNNLHGVASRVASNAGEVSHQARIVAESAGEVSRNVQSVAAGTEEMGTSISEIARNAHEAAHVATGAVAAVDATTAAMTKLGDSSREVGDVVRLITSIAEQTNLLALNATIEAARAGDAGKGFAVVADEVKQLAQETARATDDISRRVETIQQDATLAGQAISEIASVIQNINDYQTTIASAVEQQTATTSEMSRGVVDAASGSGYIAENITIFASAAEATAEAGGEALNSAGELRMMSEQLSTLLSAFRF